MELFTGDLGFPPNVHTVICIGLGYTSIWSYQRYLDGKKLKGGNKMDNRNQLKLRHYIIGIFAVVAILGTAFTMSTRGITFLSFEDVLGNIFCPMAYISLLVSVIAYYMKKDLLSKILAVSGLGFIGTIIAIGLILYTVFGEVLVFPYLIFVAVLLSIGLFIWLFLRDE